MKGPKPIDPEVRFWRHVAEPEADRMGKEKETVMIDKSDMNWNEKFYTDRIDERLLAVDALKTAALAAATEARGFRALLPNALAANAPRYATQACEYLVKAKKLLTAAYDMWETIQYDAKRAGLDEAACGYEVGGDAAVGKS